MCRLCVSSYSLPLGACSSARLAISTQCPGEVSEKPGASKEPGIGCLPVTPEAQATKPATQGPSASRMQYPGAPGVFSFKKRGHCNAARGLPPPRWAGCACGLRWGLCRVVPGRLGCAVPVGIIMLRERPAARPRRIAPGRRLAGSPGRRSQDAKRRPGLLVSPVVASHWQGGRYDDAGPQVAAT